MKKFNINNYIYIQITDEGWIHLNKTLSDTYIENCIETDQYKKVINGELWYRLQFHQVMELLPECGVHYNSNIIFEDEYLEEVEKKFSHQGHFQMPDKNDWLGFH